MKKIFFVAILFMANTQAVKIKLTAEVLNQRLHEEQGLEYFMQKTDVVDKLANKELLPAGVVVIFDAALNNYYNYLEQKKHEHRSKMIELLQERRTNILETILRDSPEAIKELKESELI